LKKWSNRIQGARLEVGVGTEKVLETTLYNPLEIIELIKQRTRDKRKCEALSAQKSIAPMFGKIFPVFEITLYDTLFPATRVLKDVLSYTIASHYKWSYKYIHKKANIV
jgi:hypothetical protein